MAGRVTISPTADPSTIVATVAFTVRSILAFTGSDPQSALLAGATLLLLGAVLLVARNRGGAFCRVFIVGEHPIQ